MTCSLSKYCSATPPRDSQGLVFVQPVVPSSPRDRSVSLSLAVRYPGSHLVFRRVHRWLGVLRVSSRGYLSPCNGRIGGSSLSFLPHFLFFRFSIRTSLGTTPVRQFQGRFLFVRVRRMEFIRLLGYLKRWFLNISAAPDRRGRPAAPTITRTIG